MMSPSGPLHGYVANNVAFALTAHVKRQGLGMVWTADPGFVISEKPDTVRAPDVALMRKGRAGKLDASGFFHGAPDLAVEVLSPSDTASEVLDKVQQWLGAGVTEVWVLDPRRKTVAVHRSVAVLKEGDTLTAPDVLSDFKVGVAELFA